MSDEHTHEHTPISEADWEPVMASAREHEASRETYEIVKSDERLMVRKLYYVMADLLDHIESDPQFTPANRDDYRQDIDSARKLIREVRENGWNRA